MSDDPNGPGYQPGGARRPEQDLRSVLTGEPDKPRLSMRPWMTGVALLSVAAFASVIWYAYRSGDNDDRPPPLIRAESGPTKVVPEEPGGLEVPNQDKLVYDELAGEAPAETEALLPAAEEPADLPGTGSAEATIPEPQPEPKPALVAPAAGGGAFMVQLGAFRESEAAARGWDRLVARYPAILEGLAQEVMVADIPGKGTYYRLRAGPFDSRSAAEATCQELKDRGQGCLIVKP